MDNRSTSDKKGGTQKKEKGFLRFLPIGGSNSEVRTELAPTVGVSDVDTTTEGLYIKVRIVGYS